MFGLIEGYKKSRKAFIKGKKRRALRIMKFYNLLHGASLHPNIVFGKNVSLGHRGIGIVIHKDAIIGDNCRIMHHVTIGGTTENGGIPKIGNNVFIGVGAVVLGGIIIGDNVKIGANAVVVKNVPNNSTAVGVPAIILNNV